MAEQIGDPTPLMRALAKEQEVGTRLLGRVLSWPFRLVALAVWVPFRALRAVLPPYGRRRD